MKRFWNKVNIVGDDECWLWIAGKNHNGYGQFRYKNKMVTAHRMAWFLKFGEIPKDGTPHGICILHKCDTPLCVNPNHLFKGTVQDNNKDKTEKGRQSHIGGEEHHQAKLKESQVIQIRQIYKVGGISCKSVAEQFKVSESLVTQIVRGSIWRHCL
jgi:hypothetical protein